MLSEHKDAKTGARWFVCTVCKVEFTSRWNAKRHVTIKHEDPVYLSCPRCDQLFGNKFYLDKHVKKSSCGPKKPM